MRIGHVSSGHVLNTRIRKHAPISQKKTSEAKLEGKSENKPRFGDSEIQEIIEEMQRKFNRIFLSDEQVL